MLNVCTNPECHCQPTPHSLTERNLVMTPQQAQQQAALDLSTLMARFRKGGHEQILLDAMYPYLAEANIESFCKEHQCELVYDQAAVDRFLGPNSALNRKDFYRDHPMVMVRNEEVVGVIMSPYAAFTAANLAKITEWCAKNGFDFTISGKAALYMPGRTTGLVITRKKS